MTVIDRNHVQVRGDGQRAMIFSHGFGCDQNMWRFVAPVGEFVRQHIPNSQLVALNASDHCPNLSAPDEVISAIRRSVR
uniref:Alpha/beta hydrolase n=1 Tax=Rhizobium leguminosarum TaxID=384 RepID=A0A179BGI7_RHILE|nr:hypothetical protein [Rhizobium leguminosarum]OAP90415.1 hypothetical protein A4U53_29700 [Rhizobium leguminosarum]